MGDAYDASFTDYSRRSPLILRILWVEFGPAAAQKQDYHQFFKA